MAVPLEQFLKQLEESGILAADTLHDHIPPKATPKDAEELARELIQHRKLTRFQAEQIWVGKGRSLALGNYILLEKLGQGGMGQVFKAQHRVMGRIVALKVLAPALVKDPSALQRFQRETMVAARLMHPNVVTAFDADQAAGTHFLVMEFVDGSDLAELVKKNGPLPTAKAIHYILQAARGLQAAHASGIVHRDIKPANLLLDKKGVVKILDMGLARIEPGAGENQAGLTATGAIMGTVDYMAPEQAISTRSATASSDIYSLGCTLFYLLTAKSTYGGDSLMAKLMAHREKPIPSIRAHRTDVPDELEAIFQKMVAKRVEDRYRAMSEVIVDLERVPGVGDPSLIPPSFSTSASGLGLGRDLSFARAVPLAPAPGTPVAPGSGVIPASGMAPLSGVAPVSATASASAIARTPSGTASSVSTPRVPLPPPKKSWRIPALLLAGSVLLALGYFGWQKMREATLVIEVDQPGADLEVLNSQKKVEFRREGVQGPVVISLPPGKHRVTAEKAGFNFYAKTVELVTGVPKTMNIELTPFVDPIDARNAKKKEFERWVADVAALPPERQTEMVTAKLKELNPRYPGTPGFVLQNGAVVNLSIDQDGVADISPLRALTRLQSVRFYGNSPENPLADLSPLRGLKLTGIQIGWTQVSDLSPLQDMPLDLFECHSPKLTDLSPLAKLPITHFECYSPNISSLAPLAGMKLTFLKVQGTQVADLSPLRGMPLETLDCANNHISDLSPIRDLPLKILQCYGNRITDLSPLRDMPLRELGCDFGLKRDMPAVKSIKTLQIINGKTVEDFWKEYDIPK